MEEYRIREESNGAECSILTLLDYEAESRDELLHGLSEIVRSEGFALDGFEDALLQREKEFPTGLELEQVSIAVPHTYPEYVRRPGVLAVRLKEPVTFIHMASEDQKVNASYVFMLLIQDSNNQVYLLQSLLEMCQDSKNLEALKTAETSKKMAMILEPFIKNSMKGEL